MDAIYPRIRAIVAADPNWIIGVNGGMPWHYKADFKRFKTVTMGSTLIMGRKTWESLPKPLPGRRMVVITKSDPVSVASTSKHPQGSCDYYPNLDVAYLAAGSLSERPAGMNNDVWIAGGGDIYKLALEERNDVEEIDLTVVPTVELPTSESPQSITYFPAKLLERFHLVEEKVNEEDSRLVHRRYARS